MIDVLVARRHQGHRTLAYPESLPRLPDRFRGRPAITEGRCPEGCSACAGACPVGAVSAPGKTPSLDLGKCLFCAACARACPTQAIVFGGDHRLAARRREDLVVPARTAAVALALEEKIRRLLGRALRLRQVSAGGCNACEADTNVLQTVVWDLARFGVQFVASPRHADGVLVTGPVPANMRLGLEKTWAAIPAPKIAIAVGACAIAGGPYAGNPEVSTGADSVVPIDLYVPGCPPHPLTILDGILRLLGTIE